MKKISIIFLGLFLILFPLVSLGQANNPQNCAMAQPGTIEAFICTIGRILNTLIPILVTAGVVVFIWGIVQYIIGSDEDSKKKGRNKIIWGLVGLVVIVAMWGLVAMVTRSFNLQNPVNVHVPCVPGTPGCM